MIRNSRCKNCGGIVKFDPKNQDLYCDNCKSHQEINKNHSHRSKNISNLELCLCPSCGAEIVTDDTNITSFCVYCKNSNIQMSKLTGAFSPQGIIPFKKTKEDAIAAFETIRRNQSLSPDDFLTKENIEEIRGIYIPFWLMDINVKGKMEAKTKISKLQTTSDPDVDYTETIKQYENNREGEIGYKLVPIDGSSHFEDDIMQCIEPFNYEELVPYSSDYIAGFLAEIYDIKSDTALETANRRIEKSAYEIFRKSLIGSNPTEIEVTSFNYTSKKVKEQYVLLPVYLLNIKYKNKIYTFAMNGQTGKIVGDFPSSKTNEVLYFLKYFLVALLITQLVLCFVNNGLTLFGAMVSLMISATIGYFFLNYERENLKVVEQDKEINEYIHDRVIEKRENTLKETEIKEHDTSRAAQITVAGALLGAMLVNGISINMEHKR